MQNNANLRTASTLYESRPDQQGRERDSRRRGQLEVGLMFPETRHHRNRSERADQAPSRAAIDLAAALPELLRLLAEPLGDRGGLLRDAVLGRVVADVLRDLHRAEVRPTHQQKWASLAPSAGSVSSGNSRAVSGSRWSRPTRTRSEAMKQWMWTKGTLVAISRLRFELESGDQLHGLLTSTTRVRLSRSCGVSPSRSSSIWCLRF